MTGKEGIVDKLHHTIRALYLKAMETLPRYSDKDGTMVHDPNGDYVRLSDIRWVLAPPVSTPSGEDTPSPA